MAMVEHIWLQGAAAELARALQGYRSGRGWVARCPAHDDRDPSFSIADGAEGRLLLRCFAGCSWSAIRNALKARSLWPERGSCPRTGAHQTYRRKARDPLHAAERCLVWELS